MAKQIMAQLIAHGEVRRGQLGIRIQDLTPALAKALKIDVAEGALVANVAPKSPAEAAGLEAGDVITMVNGEKVRNSADLRNRVGLLPVGSTVELEVIHKGQMKLVSARLAEVPPDTVAVPATAGALSGITLGPIEPGTPLYGRAEGAVVVEVKRSSRAAWAGLRPGDAIVAVNQEQVKSPADVIRIAKEAKGELLLQVVRDGSALFIVIG